MVATKADIAWAAGLFEGEGCMAIPKTGKQAHTRCDLRVKMTDLDVLERFREVMGVGYIFESKWYRNRGQKPQWVWAAGSKVEVLAALAKLEPWFGARRREKVAEVRAMYAAREAAAAT